MEQAEQHGLQYVTDYDFRGALPGHYQKEVAEALMSRARSIVEMEQYLDFLRSRSFRQTLLCHAGQAVQRTLKAERLAGLYVASRAVPETTHPDMHSRAVEKFKGTDGSTLSIDHPVSKAAMVLLAQTWPQVIAFDGLVAAARDFLAAHGPPVAPQPEDEQVLAVNLLRAYLHSSDLVELHAFPLPFARRPGPRPVASPWVRWQAQHDANVTNLRHERVELDALNQFLVRQLDGTRDIADLVALLLAESVAGGKLVVEQDDVQVTDPAERQAVVAGELEANLRWLAGAALLVE